MPNPTVRWVLTTVPNSDGTISLLKESHRADGHISIIHPVRDPNGRTALVLHYVYNPHGQIVHGPEEKFRRSGYQRQPDLAVPRR